MVQIPSHPSSHATHAPSLPYPAHRYIVEEARKIGVADVIDRCNLTVLLEPGQEDLPAYLAAHRVRVVASLPCYGAENVDKQRGMGVFERSIEGLRVSVGGRVRGAGRTAFAAFGLAGGCRDHVHVCVCVCSLLLLQL